MQLRFRDHVQSESVEECDEILGGSKDEGTRSYRGGGRMRLLPLTLRSIDFVDGEAYSQTLFGSRAFDLRHVKSGSTALASLYIHPISDRRCLGLGTRGRQNHH